MGLQISIAARIFLTLVIVFFAPLAQAIDSDGDGVAINDNCSFVANPDQRDTNGDGFGNICDPDLNNDGIVNFADLAIMKAAFFGNNADADLNGDGAVNFGDLAIMKTFFFKAPGPADPLLGTVSGKVVSAATGAGIPGASISAGSATATSAADGGYTLTAGVGARVVINIEAADFAETIQVARVTTGQTASLGVQLLPIGVTRTVNVAAGGTVTVPNSSAQVTIPAGGLVSATGGAPAATVNVSVIPINPAIDPDIMPGDYTTVPAGGGPPVPIESFGALLVDIRDASGTQYNLAAGQTSTIRIPLGTLSASPPSSIPLFYFDESTGRWVQEGTAILAGTALNQYYEGTVTRLRYWNADEVMNTVFVTGCVRDTANQPVENVRVKTNGINYSGSASTFTAADGSFRVAVRRGGLATLDVTFYRNGKPITTTVNVGPYTADFTLTPCIVTEPAPLEITARLLPSGIVGTAYDARLAASNGTRPYSWNVTSGALPTGLTLTGATGQISGTPTAAGTFTATIQAQDSSTPLQSATVPFSITIIPVSSGGGGTLTVANAPVSVGGAFVANERATVNVQSNIASIYWDEGFFSEILTLGFNLTTGQGFFYSTFVGGGTGWTCDNILGGISTSGYVSCNGIMIDRTAGTVNFANQELRSNISAAPPITLNGTLNFTPF